MERAFVMESDVSKLRWGLLWIPRFVSAVLLQYSNVFSVCGSFQVYLKTKAF
ncbi:hypothetical protein D3C75_1356360 [compost metagenome]